MATITLTVKDTIATEVQGAVCAIYGYQPILADGTTNPQSQNQFVIAQLKNFLQQAVIQNRINTAATSAKNQDAFL